MTIAAERPILRTTVVRELTPGGHEKHPDLEGGAGGGKGGRGIKKGKKNPVESVIREHRENVLHPRCIAIQVRLGGPLPTIPAVARPEQLVISESFHILRGHQSC
jgi:hypothetical protein